MPMIEAGFAREVVRVFGCVLFEEGCVGSATVEFS